MTTEPGAQQPSPDANADAPFTAPDPEQ
ncbi:DNA-binding protein, partial [Streptomyces sp. NRRL WC-3753]